MTTGDVLLDVRISADYRGRADVLRDVVLTVREGEILGLIGQSGSGKSTVAMAILRLLELRGGAVRGRIDFAGRDLLAASERELRAMRGREISLVLQSPAAALNPALRRETHLREVWRAHRAESWKTGRASVLALLAGMDLPAGDAFLRSYPRQVSVGQAQRVVIAMAVMHGPRLIIADEPTSALDPVSQSEILALFARLNRERGTALLYISHDLRSVASFCHSLAVIEGGRIVESGPAAEVLQRPSQDYTRRLVALAG